MADDARLREMYAASHPVPAGAHPSDEDWEHLAMGEMSRDERARVADHVVSCADCAEIYRGLRELEDGARVFDPGAPRRAADILPFRSRATWYAGLAAAAVLILAVVLPFRQPPSGSDDVTRGGTADAPVAVTPVGDLASPPDRFRWTPAPGVSRHRVELSRADGEPLWTSAPAEGSDTPWPAELALAPGVYYWRVVTLPDPDRRTSSVASPLVSFRITGRP